MNASAEDSLTEQEVLGQMSWVVIVLHPLILLINPHKRTLTFAAMDTTSSALARTLWLLSIHQDVQEKLRFELREARAEHGDIAYDELVALPYLDAICRETLRVWVIYTQKSTFLCLKALQVCTCISHNTNVSTYSTVFRVFVSQTHFITGD